MFNSIVAKINSTISFARAETRKSFLIGIEHRAQIDAAI